jgi:hypothetical protein
MFPKHKLIWGACFALVMVLGVMPKSIAMAVPPPTTTTTIVADSSDFCADEIGYDSGTNWDLSVGDTGGDPLSPYTNIGERSLIKFSLAGLGKIQSAELCLTIIQSRWIQDEQTGIVDNEAPFTNPGLGNTVVIHIADYGDPGQEDYSAPSIGNNPGMLIQRNTQPSSVVSIDVTGAVRRAMRLGESFVAFRIQTATESDNDCFSDRWHFASADNPEASYRPTIQVNCG